MKENRYIYIFLIIYFLFFTLSTPIFSQSPTAKFRSTPQPQLTKTLTRNYIPLSSNITLMTDNKTDNTLIIKDYLNSTRVIIDGTGKTINTISYYPYGAIRGTPLRPPFAKASEVTQQGSAGQATDKLFTNHRKLSELSVYHAGARFYSPTLGTFIQPDTVEGPNRYGYVNNNPVMFNDPTGNMVANKDMLGYEILESGTEYYRPKRKNDYGNDILNDTIDYHLSRNPFDSKIEQQKYIRWIMKDINLSHTLLPALREQNDKYNKAKNRLMDRSESYIEARKLNLGFFSSDPNQIKAEQIRKAAIHEVRLNAIKGSIFEMLNTDFTSFIPPVEAYLAKIIPYDRRIKNGWMDCTNYSRLTSQVVNEAGIEMYYVANQNMGHAYNLVNISDNNQDNYWVVDAMFNEMTPLQAHQRRHLYGGYFTYNINTNTKQRINLGIQGNNPGIFSKFINGLRDVFRMD